jgi:hypothetical protein
VVQVARESCHALVMFLRGMLPSLSTSIAIAIAVITARLLYSSSIVAVTELWHESTQTQLELLTTKIASMTLSRLLHVKMLHF